MHSKRALEVGRKDEVVFVPARHREINRGREVSLDVELAHLALPATHFHVYRTSVDEDRADLGEVAVADGRVQLTVAPRSINRAC